MNMTTNALIEERTDTKIKFKGNWYEQSLLIHDNNIISFKTINRTCKHSR